MSEITFSEGTAADVAANLHPSADTLRDQLSILEAAHGDEIVLARLDDEVVGYLAARSHPLRGTTVWEHVVVPAFRGIGVGRRLLLEIAKRTPPLSRLTIDPTGDFKIDEIAAYYARLGFPRVSTDGFHVAAPAHEVVDAIGEQTEEASTLEMIMRRRGAGVTTISPDAPLVEALALMAEQRIGSVVVSSDGETVDGLLAERDVVVAAHSSGSAMFEGVVGDYMTADVVTAESSAVIARVMDLATIKRLRHVPVTENGKLRSIVSIGDLLMFRMREHDMRREHLPHRET